MNRRLKKHTPKEKGIPHARGDEPRQLIAGSLLLQYSPRTWG